MKRSWPVVGLVTALCIAAGVAVAGLPSDDAPTLVLRPGSLPSTTDASVQAPSSAPVDPSPTSSTTPGSGGTDDGATSTTATSSGSSVAVELGRAAVRVVLTGSQSLPLAANVADQLRALGYLTVLISNSLTAQTNAQLYYRPGFEQEARTVAADLQLLDIPIVPLPLVPITVDDSQADVVVVLGEVAG